MSVSVENRVLKIAIDDEIDDFWGVSVTSIRRGIAAYSGQYDNTVDVYVNSPGGSVTEGIAIRNEILKLREQGKTVNVEIGGIAASIAGPIAVAGDSLKMRPGTFLMIHEPTSSAYGINYKEAESLATLLQKVRNELIDIFVDSSNLSKEEVENYISAETWFTAKEAVDFGFADEILSDSSGVRNCMVRKDEKYSILNSFKNTPKSVKIIEKKEQPKNKKETKKETPMSGKTLSDFYSSNEGLEKVVENKVNDAVSKGKTEAVKNESARIFEILEIAGVEMSEDLSNAIKEGTDAGTFAIAFVKNQRDSLQSAPEPKNEEEESPEGKISQTIDNKQIIPKVLNPKNGKEEPKEDKLGALLKSCFEPMKNRRRRGAK